MGPINGLSCTKQAKPSNRSRRDDSTECERYPLRSRQALGRRDRPDVPQRLCPAAADGTGDCVVLPRASWQPAAVGGTDEPDEPSVCVCAGSVCDPASDSRRAVSEGGAQGRGDGEAPSPVRAGRRSGLHRQGQEKTPVFRTEKRTNPRTGKPYPWIVRAPTIVNHY